MQVQSTLGSKCSQQRTTGTIHMDQGTHRSARTMNWSTNLIGTEIWDIVLSNILKERLLSNK